MIEEIWAIKKLPDNGPNFQNWPQTEGTRVSGCNTMSDDSYAKSLKLFFSFEHV